MPLYKSAPIRIGRLVKADLTVNLASGKLFADDVLAESGDEFASGSIAMGTDDLAYENAAVLYGAAVTDGAVRCNVGDDQSTGDLAYFKKHMRRKKVLYKCYFYPLVKAAEILSQQGGLARRGLGYGPQPMTDAETIAATLPPSEIATLKLAVPSTLFLGYGREIEPENGGINLGLAELDAQKSAVTRPHYIHAGMLAGLSKNETLLSTPWEIGGLWKPYLQAHGVKQREPEDG